MGTEHKHNTHLEKNPKGIPNVIGIEFLEALSTIPTLKQKSLAHGGLAELLLEASGLTSEDNRGESLKGFDDGIKLDLIRVFGELESLLGLPAVDSP